MKKIVFLIICFVGFYSNAQTPINDCAESPLIINACGTNFSVTQAQMALATTDENCQAGGSCPIIYVNGVGYEDLDCDGDDDWSGTIENSLFWQFTSDVSCNYTITVSATNCCCREKGSTNAAQVQIYNTTGTLPGGNIVNNPAGNNSFTGTQTFTIFATVNNPVLIALDGLEGSDCDIAVSVQPSTGCAGCTLLEHVKKERINNSVKAPKRERNVIYYDVYGRQIPETNLINGIYIKHIRYMNGEENIEKILILN